MSLRVRIFQPAKSTMQSGRGKTHEWSIEPELASAHLPEPVMGWTSATDTLTELKYRMHFNDKAQAIAFAEKQGWEYSVIEPAARVIVPKNYLDNFKTTRPQDE
ncbi:MAG: ETC complex I subunit [Alphaproteobacteria bacterium]|nr:ETC complex I subunit [Alphaproteobacteria bacterium]